ncbi:DegT/DnrJ/EryC1/StrS family aminotransferase [Salinibacter ruber]|jgi:dTDP-4-amino-4,6-dideoxygalactose transaminase|uniref:DegT/DnrJ/EryC1/StrS family aminotransferase n=1 Tax=Salinibacter ruber TaxID=146919 RepID=UPI00160D99F5|nr:DegT/DnrJ/EryC1/StrS family aminotransferase [Salinibacter ruber]MBB4062658.1 dTDP-4-amino-4,6-dideoxygalactose transaminase [Salinibacter ruber]
MDVPFLDLGAQYESIKDEVHEAMESVLENTSFALGPAVEEFEANYASYCQTDHCVGVSSGTAALHVALHALGIGEGDEVITTPHTFVSTVWAISYVGATPVFADIDPGTYTIDPEAVEAAVTEKTEAIVPVHLYGQPADMDPILNIADEHDLFVVEDAAQAHGAEYKGQRAGSIGDIGCFSFYPGKNLGAYGEAGAVVTDDAPLAEKMAELRDHAQPEKYVHNDLGYNYRMDGLQGAVLNVKLRHLDDWTDARRRVAQRYEEELSPVGGVETPHEASYAKHVYHLYELQMASEEERNALQDDLDDSNVSTGLHYPTPIHLQEAYDHLGYEVGDFLETERAASRNLSLPMYPEMTDEMISYVSDKIKQKISAHANT